MREVAGGPGGPFTGIGRRRPPESGCSGMQPQEGGKPHPRLNTGERPIANKYREGKMKRTLRRESKALEIAGREALGARRLRARRDVRRRSGCVAGGNPRRAFGGTCGGRAGERASASGSAVRAGPPSPRPSRWDGQRRPGGRQGGGDGPGERGNPPAAGRLAGRRPRGRGRRKTRAFAGRGREPRRLRGGRGPGTRRSFACGRLGRPSTLASSGTPARRPRAARLETRTKESDACASRRASGAPRAERKRGTPQGVRGGKVGARPRPAPSADPDFLERFEQERTRRDPKDRELWATRTRPEETLVEVRSGTDVQIVRQSCL